MLSHRSAGIVFLTCVVLPFALVTACDKVPLLAPTGSVITLLPVTNTVSLNSQIDIIATVIENGTTPGGTGSTGTSTSTAGAGTPVQNGTLVSFTTTVGRIEPSEARTHNGQVTVKLVAGGASGTATVTAYSGGASAQTKLLIGTAAVKTVTLTATPQSLGSNGGSVQVTAVVTDEGGNPLSGVPVTFSTDRGSISPSSVTTDASGVAAATLTTNGTAKILASVGAVKSNELTVPVNARALSSFTASPASASAGVPITFEVTPTTGANISNVVIDFGDGQSTPLGAISGKASVPHAYRAAGTYTATARATDGTGETSSLSTTVIIGASQVILTAPPVATVNSPVVFTVTLPPGTQVDHLEWTFDDGTPVTTTTSTQLTHTFTTRGLKNVRFDVFAVGGGKIGSAAATLVVQ
jgi:hypothetical protein